MKLMLLLLLLLVTSLGAFGLIEQAKETVKGLVHF